MIEACPEVWAPVLGDDGQVYGNECYARMAGAAVVQHLDPSTLSGLGCAGCTPGMGEISSGAIAYGIVALVALAVVGASVAGQVAAERKR